MPAADVAAAGRLGDGAAPLPPMAARAAGMAAVLG